MKTEKTGYRAQVIRTLLVLFAGGLLAALVSAAVSQPVVSAPLSAKEKAESDPVEGAGSLAGWFVLPLDSTSTITSYLPVIHGSPSSTTCNPTGGSGGFAPGRYETTVGGLNATVVVGEGYHPGTPTYLGFFIHGDNGSWTKFQTSSNPVTQFVNQHNWIFVAPQSPNGGQSWWTSWSGDHNEAFAHVLDEMFAKYNVCRNVVFGSSGSGGSEFWTTYFFPEEGDRYPAHTVIGCGGDDGLGSAGDRKIIALGQDPNVVARSTFEYVYGTEDYLYNLIQQSIEIYTEAGFTVYVHEIPGAGHCNRWTDEGLPNLSERIAQYWGVRGTALGVLDP